MNEIPQISADHALKVRNLMRNWQRLWITGNLQELDRNVQKFMALPAPAGETMRVAMYGALLQEVCALQVEASGSVAAAIQTIKDAGVLDAMNTQMKKDGNG